MMENQYSTPNKDGQTPTKSTNSHNQTREGDWICFNCNNLNFSFRKRCNRCKTQTRKQNQDIQSAYTYYYYNQQPEGNVYNFDENNIYMPMNEQIYHVSEIKVDQDQRTVVGNFLEVPQRTLAFSRNNQDIQVVDISDASPFKLLSNSDLKAQQKTNQKLRTPSSKKRKTQNRKNDMLPSVSPLLKKLLEKQNTNNKQNISSQKDPLNVALFYDEVWNNNKENIQNCSSVLVNHENKTCLTVSGKKILGSSRIHRTNDSLNGFQEQGFDYFLQSPQKQYNQDNIIQIDQEDEQLAQIIGRIMI